ncbi:MAG: hypothetical protein VXY92_05090, partial [Planctomycetota bacterium]|nr:hypothetical protein [Planctomycetota bacterium]
MTGDTHNNGESGDVVRDVWGEDFVVEDLCDGDAVCQGGEGSVGSASFGDGSSADSGESEAGLEAEIDDAMRSSGALSEHASDASSTWPAGLDAARDSFADALDAMIRADDDLAIDADAELDVINANSDAGSSAPEPFLLDDNDVSWAAQAAGAGSTEVASGEVAAGEKEDEAPDDVFGYVRADDIGSPSAEAESDVSGASFRSWFGGDEDALRLGDAATVDAAPVDERALGPVVEPCEVPPARAESAGRDLLGAAAVSEPWDAGEGEAGAAGAHGESPPLGDHWARGDACDDSLGGHESCVQDGDGERVLIGGPGARKRRWSG